MCDERVLGKKKRNENPRKVNAKCRAISKEGGLR
jgi:hypothetical protein